MWGNILLLTHQYNHVHTVQILTIYHIHPYATHGLGPIVVCTVYHIYVHKFIL